MCDHCCSFIKGICQDFNIPDNFDPEVFMDYLDKRVEEACPSGIDRCECVHAPGQVLHELSMDKDI